ncbi:glycosyltransferase family 4 protein [Amnibacterium flavum]|uniref:D-inositol 3-phosphate glycosyltransferase n=1 Tax=Amnibacterium flavum TaxID=2173173 RepID=A0A2V1HUV2_9MICO|nr:glycosyltransferase family 1 protein [Amnibacterium flavum]PVZ96368.1 glycosyl transferase [Amnibacterium flavum]
MRVAVVSESFLPTVNGVTTSVARVLEHLAAGGHEAVVLSPGAGAPSEYAGFRVHRMPAVAYRQFPVGLPSPSVQRVLDEFAPDVVHAASPFLLGGHALSAARKRGTPSVAIYQTDVAGFARRNRLGVTSSLAWQLVRRVHENADLTLVPSSAALTDCRAAGIPRLARWGRGVDLERYHPRNRDSPAVRALRDQLAPSGETVVGYIGRIAPEKQVERLRELRGLPGVRFAIVGDGPATASVQRALRGMPVTWLGRLGGTALADAYAALDVFVHTGTEETFGQTIQEAHASGLPVVAPAAGGPIDLVDTGVDGALFDPALPGGLRGAVEPLTSDALDRARLGEAGRRRVLGRSWETVCRELIGHYDAVRTARSLTAGAGSPEVA